MTDHFERLIGPLIEREGGFVDHKDDKGGATCWGVTEAVARANGYQGAMRDMPRSVAVAIYRKLYWTAPRFDKVAEVAPQVAEELFDTGVNMGQAVAAKFLQRALNVLNLKGAHWPDLAVDGQIGLATLGALDALLRRRGPTGERVLLIALNVLQGARYIELAEARQENESFVFGWLANRVGLAHG